MVKQLDKKCSTQAKPNLISNCDKENVNFTKGNIEKIVRSIKKQFQGKEKLPYDQGMQLIDWSEIKIRGKSEEECKLLLRYFMQSTRDYRTVDEKLSDIDITTIHNQNVRDISTGQSKVLTNVENFASIENPGQLDSSTKQSANSGSVNDTDNYTDACKGLMLEDISNTLDVEQNLRTRKRAVSTTPRETVIKCGLLSKPKTKNATGDALNTFCDKEQSPTVPPTLPAAQKPANKSDSKSLKPILSSPSKPASAPTRMVGGGRFSKRLMSMSSIQPVIYSTEDGIKTFRNSKQPPALQSAAQKTDNTPASRFQKRLLTSEPKPAVAPTSVLNRARFSTRLMSMSSIEPPMYRKNFRPSGGLKRKHEPEVDYSSIAAKNTIEAKPNEDLIQKCAERKKMEKLQRETLNQRLNKNRLSKIEKESMRSWLNVLKSDM